MKIYTVLQIIINPHEERRWRRIKKKVKRSSVPRNKTQQNITTKITITISKNM